MSSVLYELAACFYFGWMALRNRGHWLGWSSIAIVGISGLFAFIRFIVFYMDRR